MSAGLGDDVVHEGQRHVLISLEYKTIKINYINRIFISV